MKDFRVCNHDLDNWIERTFHDAIAVVRFIKWSNLTTYEIEHKSPISGEYIPLIFVKDGVTTYKTNVLKLPVAFNKLGNESPYEDYANDR